MAGDRTFIKNDRGIEPLFRMTEDRTFIYNERGIEHLYRMAGG